MGTDTDPGLVNITAGLFHVAALPVTEIGLSLAYRDLQARATERSPRTVAGVRMWAISVLHLAEGRKRDR